MKTSHSNRPNGRVSFLEKHVICVDTPAPSPRVESSQLEKDDKYAAHQGVQQNEISRMLIAQEGLTAGERAAFQKYMTNWLSREIRTYDVDTQSGLSADELTRLTTALKGETERIIQEYKKKETAQETRAAQAEAKKETVSSQMEKMNAQFDGKNLNSPEGIRMEMTKMQNKIVVSNDLMQKASLWIKYMNDDLQYFQDEVKGWTLMGLAELTKRTEQSRKDTVKQLTAWKASLERIIADYRTNNQQISDAPGKMRDYSRKEYQEKKGELAKSREGTETSVAATTDGITKYRQHIATLEKARTELQEKDLAAKAQGQKIADEKTVNEGYIAQLNGILNELPKGNDDRKQLEVLYSALLSKNASATGILGKIESTSSQASDTSQQTNLNIVSSGETLAALQLTSEHFKTQLVMLGDAETQLSMDYETKIEGMNELDRGVSEGMLGMEIQMNDVMAFDTSLSEQIKYFTDLKIEEPSKWNPMLYVRKLVNGTRGVFNGLNSQPRWLQELTGREKFLDFEAYYKISKDSKGGWGNLLYLSDICVGAAEGVIHLADGVLTLVEHPVDTVSSLTSLVGINFSKIFDEEARWFSWTDGNSVFHLPIANTTTKDMGLAIIAWEKWKEGNYGAALGQTFAGVVATVAGVRALPKGIRAISRARPFQAARFAYQGAEGSGRFSRLASATKALATETGQVVMDSARGLGKRFEMPKAIGECGKTLQDIRNSKLFNVEGKGNVLDQLKQYLRGDKGAENPFTEAGDFAKAVVELKRLQRYEARYVQLNRQEVVRLKAEKTTLERELKAHEKKYKNSIPEEKMPEYHATETRIKAQLENISRNIQAAQWKIQQIQPPLKPSQQVEEIQPMEEIQTALNDLKTGDTIVSRGGSTREVLSVENGNIKFKVTKKNQAGESIVTEETIKVAHLDVFLEGKDWIQRIERPKPMNGGAQTVGSTQEVSPSSRTEVIPQEVNLSTKVLEEIRTQTARRGQIETEISRLNEQARQIQERVTSEVQGKSKGKSQQEIAQEVDRMLEADEVFNSANGRLMDLQGELKGVNKAMADLQQKYSSPEVQEYISLKRREIDLKREIGEVESQIRKEIKGEEQWKSASEAKLEAEVQARLESHAHLNTLNQKLFEAQGKIRATETINPALKQEVSVSESVNTEPGATTSGKPVPADGVVPEVSSAPVLESQPQILGRMLHEGPVQYRVRLAKEYLSVDLPASIMTAMQIITSPSELLSFFKQHTPAALKNAIKGAPYQKSVGFLKGMIDSVTMRPVFAKAALGSLAVVFGVKLARSDTLSATEVRELTDTEKTNLMPQFQSDPIKFNLFCAMNAAGIDDARDILRDAVAVKRESFRKILLEHSAHDNTYTVNFKKFIDYLKVVNNDGGADASSINDSNIARSIGLGEIFNPEEVTQVNVTSSSGETFNGVSREGRKYKTQDGKYVPIWEGDTVEIKAGSLFSPPVPKPTASS